MREDHFDVDERKEDAGRKSGSTDLLARLMQHHPELTPAHLRPRPPDPKPEPEPISPEPAPIPDITITDELLRIVTVKAIQTFVCREYDISRKEHLLSARRTQHLTKPRHVAIYLAHELTDLSLPMLGRLFKRDHTSILHAIRLVTKRRTIDQTLSNHISALQSRFLAELAPEPVS